MSDKRRYPFLRRFEAALCFAVATSPRAFSAVGHALDPERMNEPGAELVVRAAQVVARDHGAPPASREIVAQRIRSIVHEGKVTFERLQEAEALLDLAEDCGLADDVDAIIAEASPVVRDFAGQDVVNQLVGSLSKGVDPVEMSERFEGVASIGTVRESNTDRLRVGVDDVKDAVSNYAGERLTTGIPDVDRMLCGGVERGTISVVLGTTGVGKSQFLVQIAAESLLAKHSVAYFTLELDTRTIKARVLANLTNMTFEEIGREPERCSERVEQLWPRMGDLRLAYFSANVTTPADLQLWLREQERADGFRPRVIVVDMGDHLVSKVNSERRSYEEMKIVYAAIRDMAKARDGWAWSASHVKTGHVGKRRVTSDAVSDSAEKSRLADVMLSITQTDEDKNAGLIRFGLPKRRAEDDANTEAGPVARDLARGRIASITRDLPWG